jgi:protein-disulfide isomerase
MSEEKTKSNAGTVTFKKTTLWKVGTFVFAALFVLSFFGGFNGFGSGGSVGTGTGSAVAPTNPSAPNEPSKVSASADDDARIGSPDAPVEIIEFSDFQCPFCARAAPTVKQILDEYGDDVTFVYRDFPLDSIHPFATPAAIASECVREEGGDDSYFEYHDKIFANQGALSDASLKSWAQELGYNIDECLDSQKYLDEVRKDLADAQAAGGRGTPYFVIIGSDGEGTPLSGAQPFSAFKQIIDAKLA